MDSLAGTKILAGLFTAVLIATAGCGESAKLPLSATVGSDPVIPPPEKTMIPTLHIATAKVTMSETIARSSITPVLSSRLRVAAMNMKKER